GGTGRTGLNGIGGIGGIGTSGSFGNSTTRSFGFTRMVFPTPLREFWTTVTPPLPGPLLTTILFPVPLPLPVTPFIDGPPGPPSWRTTTPGPSTTTSPPFHRYTWGPWPGIGWGWTGTTGWGWTGGCWAWAAAARPPAATRAASFV